MIVLISCSVHDNEDGKTNGNFGVIKKNSLILEYGRDSVERPKSLVNPAESFASVGKISHVSGPFSFLRILHPLSRCRG